MNRTRLVAFFGTMLLTAAAAWPQSLTLTGAGYLNPVPIRVSPGQVVTFYLAGLNMTLAPEKAKSLPLPTILAGISATLTQTVAGTSAAVPLFSVDQVSACSPGQQAPACFITAVTVQIPFEMKASNPLIAAIVDQIGVTQIFFQTPGSVSSPMELVPVMDNVHVLTNCDPTRSPDNGGVQCSSLVTHADGTLVTSTAPAKPGEVLVLYAWGMGMTNPPAKSGQAAGMPTPLVETPLLDVFYGANIGTPFPVNLPNIFGARPRPLFSYAGLTPSFVGLYQVNFQIPSPPSDLPACGPAVQWNTRVRLWESVSFDSAHICVIPQ
jgi:uncharacterized protein (TIGR03437 family)